MPAESVTVYRLPGERLGFGLKFQGGTRSTECIQKLFIQSCAADSPASRAQTSWGHLREGDEIVEIDGRPVVKLTRLECVRSLKESQLTIQLTVRNGGGEEKAKQSGHSKGAGATAGAVPPKPPPVPPRKINRRKGTAGAAGGAPKTARSTANGSGNDAKAPVAEKLLKQVVSGATTATKEKSFTPPPDAEFYINLFSGKHYIQMILF